MPKPHTHQRDITCSCNPLAAEPNENCPQHGGGSPKPPRCVHCGQMMAPHDFDYLLAYETLINLARAANVGVIDYFPFRAHNAFTIGPGPDFQTGQTYLVLIQPTTDIKARLCALAHELGHWFEPCQGPKLIPLKLNPKELEQGGTSESTAHYLAKAILELLQVPNAKALYAQALRWKMKW